MTVLWPLLLSQSHGEHHVSIIFGQSYAVCEKIISPTVHRQAAHCLLQYGSEKMLSLVTEPYRPTAAEARGWFRFAFARLGASLSFLTTLSFRNGGSKDVGYMFRLIDRLRETAELVIKPH